MGFLRVGVGGYGKRAAAKAEQRFHAQSVYAIER
jgi:hypothetical protein